MNNQKVKNYGYGVNNQKIKNDRHDVHNQKVKDDHDVLTQKVKNNKIMEKIWCKKAWIYQIRINSNYSLV